MQVFVRLVTGDVASVDVTQAMTLGEFKEAVWRATEVDTTSQKLIFNGEEIDGDEAIEMATVGVGAEDVVDVQLTTKGVARLTLLDYGIPAPNNDALVRAALSGDTHLVQILLSAGAAPNHCHAYGGETALSQAVLKGHIDTARCLLNHGADPNTSDEWGNTALHYLALGSADSKLTKVLLQKSADPMKQNHKGCNPLMVAVSEGRYTVAEHLLPVTDVRMVDKKGMTVLMHVVASGLTEIHSLATPIIAAGCPVNSVDSQGQPALFYCAGKPSPQAILLSQGADPTVIDIFGRSLYYHAAAVGDVPLIQMLLSKGVPCNTVKPPDGTPLHVAVSEHNYTAAVLLAGHCDLTMKDARGKTAFELYTPGAGAAPWPSSEFLRSHVK